MRWWVCVGFCLMVACNNPAPVGQELLSVDILKELPKEESQGLGPLEAFGESLTLPGGGVVKVEAKAASAASGARLLTVVKVSVVDAQGWEMEGSQYSAPINVGGPGAKAVMSVDVPIRKGKKSVGGLSFKTHVIQVTAKPSIKLVN